MSITVAINGLGRIGRALLTLLTDEPSIELVALNDLVMPRALPTCFASTRCTGRYSKALVIEGDTLVVAGRKLPEDR